MADPFEQGWTCIGIFDADPEVSPMTLAAAWLAERSLEASLAATDLTVQPLCGTDAASQWSRERRIFIRSSALAG